MTLLLFVSRIDLRQRNRYRLPRIACVPILRFVHTLARKDDLSVMTMRESWTDYVGRITEGRPRKEVAAAAGIDVSGISRWLNSASMPRAEKVISFARGLAQSPVEALIAAGYLDEGDVDNAVEVVQSLSALSDDALIEELAGRLRRRHANQPQTGLTRVQRHLSRKGIGVEQTDDRGQKRS